MSSPVDDEPGATSEPDPAISYPRGNRLGIRHPRPTVVIVVAVLVVLAGAFAWRAVQPPRSVFCELTGAAGPLGSNQTEAFEAWYADGGAASAFTKASSEDAALSGGPPSGPPTIDDFERFADDWRWTVDDHLMIRVDVSKSPVSDGYRVSGVNRCRYGSA